MTPLRLLYVEDNCELRDAMSLLLVWRHAANIRKLLAGTESRIGQKAGRTA